MKSVEVRYFALLREEAGRDMETLDVNCRTYAELYEVLREKHKFRLPGTMVQVAVNDEYVTLQSEVTPGARVVFIPPVAGG